MEEEPRKLRDRGEAIREHFYWKKAESKTYLERYRAAKKVK
jgi:hypothetical protein